MSYARAMSLKDAKNVMNNDSMILASLFGILSRNNVLTVGEALLQTTLKVPSPRRQPPPLKGDDARFGCVHTTRVT